MAELATRMMKLARLDQVQPQAPTRPSGALPWRVVEGFNATAAVVDRDGKSLFLCTQSTAHMIVMAVNTRSDLLATVDRSVETLRGLRETFSRATRTAIVTEALAKIDGGLSLDGGPDT